MIRDEAYENVKIYKEHTKSYYDKGLVHKSFLPEMKVFLFNSHLILFLEKLKSRCCGPFTISKIFPHRVVELLNPKPQETFKVNWYHMKPYLEEGHNKVNIECIQVYNL